MNVALPTTDFNRRLSAGQRRALFAAALARGLSIDELRALTPRQSVSALTVREAAALLDALNGRTGGVRGVARKRREPRRPAEVYAVATQAQFAKIEAVRIELGWTRERLADFLAARRYDHGGPMSIILSTRDGRDVLQLLSVVLKRTKAAAALPPGDGSSNGARSRPT